MSGVSCLTLIAGVGMPQPISMIKIKTKENTPSNVPDVFFVEFRGIILVFRNRDGSISVG
jgi:hypothetical protein